MFSCLFQPGLKQATRAPWSVVIIFDISKRLVECRYNSGLNIAEAARAAKIINPDIRLDPSQLSRMERAKIEIPLPALLALLEVYQVSISKFFGESSESELLNYITDNQTLAGMLGNSSPFIQKCFDDELRSKYSITISVRVIKNSFWEQLLGSTITDLTALHTLPIHTAMGKHDRYSFLFLSREENAENFFGELLPDDIKKVVDLESIRLESARFVSPQHKDNYSDILFSFQEGDSIFRIYALLEHKSSPELDTLHQLRDYLYLAERKYPNSTIIPVIFYHGKQAWNLSETYQGQKTGTMPEARNLGERYGMNFRPILINVRQIHTKELKAGIDVVAFIQALVRSEEYDQTGAAREILLQYAGALEQETSLHNFEDLVVYIPSQYDCDWEMLVKEVGPQLPEKFQDILMTAADKIKLEGKLEAKVEMARNMKEEGTFSEEQVCKLTGLNHDQLIEAGIIFG